MGQQVVLISRSHGLATAVAAALSDDDRLTVLDAPAGLAGLNVPGVSAVIVDLPAESRVAAYEQLRAHYDGHLIMLVDHAADAAGWPDDPARRVLVRPVQAAGLVATLPPSPLPSRPRGPGAGPPQATPGAESGPARLTPQQLAESLWAPAASPAEEGVAATPATGDAPQAPAGDDEPRVARLSPGQPVWRLGTAHDRPGAWLGAPPGMPALQRFEAARAGADDPGTAGVAPEAAPRSTAAPRRVLAEVVVALVILASGVAIGAHLERPPVTQAAPAPTPTPTTVVAPTTVVVRQAPVPAACLSALDDAAAAIANLVAGIRDQQLTASLGRYRSDSAACRQASAKRG